MEPTEPKRHFAVLGAGVVGLCCAASLLREGYKVTLIDRLEPGAGTSFGNAGLIQIDAVVPIATPGTLSRVPKMLLDPKGPLVVRWRYLHAIAPWLARFVLASRPESVERISLAIASLLDRANDAWQVLVDASGAQDVWRQTGEMHVYRRKEAWEAARPYHELKRRRGSPLQELTVEEMRQLEPALSRELHAGIFTPTANSVTHPYHLSQRLAQYARSLGAEFVTADVRAVEPGGEGGAHRIVAETDTYEADAIVIAAGAFSKMFAKSVGSRIPLDTERGYHLWLPDPGVEMRRPVLAGDHRFGIVPMTGGLRLAGTVEFAGTRLPPYWERADILGELAREFVPGINLEGADRWMGYRPSLPDSLPVIGRAPGNRDVYFAFGHGHLGLTMAAITGSLVADLAAGRPPAVDLAPFRPDRF